MKGALPVILAVLEGRVKVREPRPEDVAHLQAEGGGDAVARRVSIEAIGVEVRSAR